MKTTPLSLFAMAVKTLLLKLCLIHSGTVLYFYCAVQMSSCYHTVVLIACALPLMQWFVEQVCSKLAERVQSCVGQMSITPEVSEAIQEACNPGNLFGRLTPRHSRESYYKAHFNYVVSIVFINTKTSYRKSISQKCKNM